MRKPIECPAGPHIQDALGVAWMPRSLGFLAIWYHGELEGRVKEVYCAIEFKHYAEHQH